MKRVNIIAWDVPDAWTQALSRIWTEGDIFKVGYGSEETETKKLNLSIQIKHPEIRPLVSDKAPCNMQYIQEYFATYLWMPKDKTNTSDYTYGDRLRLPVDQIDLAIERFINEPNDRQVTMTIRFPEDIFKIQVNHDADLTPKINPETKLPFRHDPPCLTMLDFEILEGKMNMTGYFRSWDCYAGLCANIAGLQLFNEQFVREIVENGYPLGNLETGEIILHSKNCHIYQRQYKLVEEMFAKQKPQVDLAATIRAMKGPNKVV